MKFPTLIIAAMTALLTTTNPASASDPCAPCVNGCGKDGICLPPEGEPEPREDAFGRFRVAGPLPCDPDTTTCDGVEIFHKGDTVIVEGPDFEAIMEPDQITWCIERKDGTSCNHTDTKWGCQYFPEEGPADDLAVCILTTLAERCCECLSVCPDEGDEGQTFDPVALIDVIAEAAAPT